MINIKFIPTTSYGLNLIKSSEWIVERWKGASGTQGRQVIAGPAFEPSVSRHY